MDYRQEIERYSSGKAVPTTTSLMPRVFGWMGFGLGLTALVSFLTVSNPQMLNTLVTTRGLFMGLLIAEFVMVIGFTALIGRISSTTAALLFTAYSAMNGLTLSTIFLVYTTESIASTFLTASVMFAGMAVYGATTRRDLTGVGSFAIMGLWGIVIASVINMFIGSSNVSWMVSFCGVIVFTLLTAYDTQKIRLLSQTLSASSEDGKKGSVILALSLYLDFINLFLSLLNLFGKRR